MKKLIKMLSYSKEGRNIFAFRSYLEWHYTKKKKKRCYLSFIFNILFFFFIK